LNKLLVVDRIMAHLLIFGTYYEADSLHTSYHFSPLHLGLKFPLISWVQQDRTFTQLGEWSNFTTYSQHGKIEVWNSWLTQGSTKLLEWMESPLYCSIAEEPWKAACIRFYTLGAIGHNGHRTSQEILF
jgi:hypothetical protein